MILSVTLNPCLDKTLIVPPWCAGDVVRGTSLREVVGGKGNNVARALSRLGREVRPVTFLGGPVGAYCEELIRRDDHLNPVVVRTASTTRVILTVRTEASPDQTAFFDPDPEIRTDEAVAMYAQVEAAMADDPVQALTLSGSSPAPTTHGLYGDLIALARARKVPVFLDTYGAALDAIWGFWPDVIQLNRREAGIRLRTPSPSEGELLALLESWSGRGVTYGVITDGPNAALVMTRGEFYRVYPPKIDVVNPIGSGDCLLAGMAHGWLDELPGERLLRQAFACAVANALIWDAGAIDPEEVGRQVDAVRVEHVGS
jgi:tagatose 6-phosphate kinase